MRTDGVIPAWVADMDFPLAPEINDELVEFVATDDIFTTNICFGGEDMRDAYLTLSGTGRLVKTRWNRPGLKLEY